MGSNLYKIKSGNVSAVDASSAPEVIGNVAGRSHSLRTVVLSNSGTAAVNIKVQDDATTPVVLLPSIYLAVNSSIMLGPFEPGAYKATENQDIDILASTANVVSAAIEVYEL